MSIAVNEAPTESDVDLPSASRPSGLLSALHNVTPSHPAWIYSGVDLEVVCDGAGMTLAFCSTLDGQVPDKEPFTGQWVHLNPMAVYALHECSSIGKPADRRAADATAALELGEQTALETFFAARALASEEAEWGSAATLIEALASAEDLTGFESGKVIHLTPGAVTLLASKGAIKKNDSGLFTYNGTTIVSGLGYVAAGLGNSSLLVTGPVLGVSGEAFTTETVLDRPTNLLSVLAEKPWALGYACGAHLIEVSPTP